MFSKHACATCQVCENNASWESEGSFTAYHVVRPWKHSAILETFCKKNLEKMHWDSLQSSNSSESYLLQVARETKWYFVFKFRCHAWNIERGTLFAKGSLTPRPATENDWIKSLYPEGKAYQMLLWAYVVMAVERPNWTRFETACGGITVGSMNKTWCSALLRLKMLHCSTLPAAEGTDTLVLI